MGIPQEFGNKAKLDKEEDKGSHEQCCSEGTHADHCNGGLGPVSLPSATDKIASLISHLHSRFSPDLISDHRSKLDVDLDLRQGEILAIVGESGSGKSTLARMLVGLDSPDAGTLRYRDQDVTRGRLRDRKILRRGVQMVAPRSITAWA